MKASLIASLIIVALSVSGLALAGSRTADTQNMHFQTEVAVSVTNGTYTLESSGTTAKPRLLVRVMFHNSAAVVGTNTVDIVKQSETNRLSSAALASVADSQWTPEYSEGYLLYPHDTVIVGNNNTITNPCSIRLIFKHQ